MHNIQSTITFCAMMTISPLPLLVGLLSYASPIAAADSTCEPTPTGASEIVLSAFSSEAQKFLKNFLATGEYYENMALHLLKTYEIRCDAVVSVQATVWTAEIFKDYIEDKLQEAAVLGKKKKVPPASPPLASIPTMAFGAKEWKKYFGDVGVEPPLPANIEEILETPCPIWSGLWPTLKVKDTHVLILVPQTIDGQPFSLYQLNAHVQKPREGHATRFELMSSVEYDNRLGIEFPCTIEKKYGPKQAPASHWVLMTKKVLDKSTNKNADQQETLIKSFSLAGVAYGIPTLLDTATCFCLEYVRTGSNEHEKGSATTSDSYGGSKLWVSFSASGLYISGCDMLNWYRDSVGRTGAMGYVKF